MRIESEVSLAARTTLRLGGAARHFVSAGDESAIATAISDADARGEPVLVLGGGSNLVIADEGFDGLVVHIASRGIGVRRDGQRARIDVAAGEPWDPFVARCVTEGLRGVECLAGIPGLVGATPIQNVGAYGQEVRETIAHVRVFDRRTRAFVDMPAEACAFTYRHSVFKGDDRFVVTRVTFELAFARDSVPIAYAELARALGVKEGERAPLDRTRDTVIALRHGKGMVVDASDPESISAGSFFVNPILDDAAIVALERRVAARGVASKMPKFPADHGLTKVSAAWLIEQAGFPKGYGDARVGISRKHALALVNRGAATTRDLVALAQTIQRGVSDAFGVTLCAEPVMVGVSLR